MDEDSQISMIARLCPTPASAPPPERAITSCSAHHIYTTQNAPFLHSKHSQHCFDVGFIADSSQILFPPPARSKSTAKRLHAVAAVEYLNTKVDLKLIEQLQVDKLVAQHHWVHCNFCVLAARGVRCSPGLGGAACGASHVLVVL